MGSKRELREAKISEPFETETIDMVAPGGDENNMQDIADILTTKPGDVEELWFASPTYSGVTHPTNPDVHDEDVVDGIK